MSEPLWESRGSGFFFCRGLKPPGSQITLISRRPCGWPASSSASPPEGGLPNICRVPCIRTTIVHSATRLSRKTYHWKEEERKWKWRKMEVTFHFLPGLHGLTLSLFRRSDKLASCLKCAILCMAVWFCVPFVRLAGLYLLVCVLSHTLYCLV